MARQGLRGGAATAGLQAEAAKAAAGFGAPRRLSEASAAMQARAARARTLHVMEYRLFVVDFSQRTLRNLDAIQELERGGADVYSVTQLWNSLLGLIVLPRERDEVRIPKWRMSRLYAEGWPRITLSPGHENMKLSSLVWNLRVAVAHFNVEFMPDDEREISSVKVWTSKTGEDNRPIEGSRAWEAQMSVHDLELLARRIAETYVSVFSKAA